MPWTKKKRSVHVDEETAVSKKNMHATIMTSQNDPKANHARLILMPMKDR